MAVSPPPGSAARHPWPRDVGPLSESRRLLRARLDSRRDEIEQAARTRVNAISDPAEVDDPAYAQGLRATVTAAIDYAIEAIEAGEERAPEPPPALLEQARRAARNGVTLDTVLRRYFAGYTLLADFLAREAEAGRLPAPAQVLPGRAAIFDRLIASVSAEYSQELERRSRSTEQRQVERVRRLLAGELVDTTGLAYDLDGHHVGLAAAGPKACEAVRDLAGSLDCRLLLVQPEKHVAWAWLGARSRLDPGDIPPDHLDTTTEFSISLGEPVKGLPGWRLTHRQAAAALLVAECNGSSIVRYRDVAILATALRDDVLAASLRDLYIAPLRRQRDEGKAALETLRAYLAADRNASSAAAALGVNRNTIAERIRAIEAAIGRPLSACGPELEAALRLAQLDGSDLG